MSSRYASFEDTDGSHDGIVDMSGDNFPSKPWAKKCCCCTCTSTCCFAAVGVLILLFAFVLILGGIGWPLAFERISYSGVQQQVILTSDQSEGYDAWVNNTKDGDAATYMSFWMFNLTNQEEFEQGEKPVLDELGPYVYREWNVYYNVTFLENGTKVEYKTYKYFTYDAELSADGIDPLTDVVTTINVPFQAVLAGLAGGAGNQSVWYSALLFEAIASMKSIDSRLVEQYAVDDILFGYTDPLLEFVGTLQPGTPATFELQVNMTSLENSDETSSSDGYYTGEGNLTNTMNQYMWQGIEEQDIWGSAEANLITGTSGQQFQPFLNGDGTWTTEDDDDDDVELTAFISNLYRHMTLSRNGTTTYLDIPLLHYIVNPDEFGNVTEVPAHYVYYANGPTGVQNLTAASQGAPIFISKPHFLDADPYYLSMLEGISPPNATIHDTFLDVEPNTGLVMNAAKRLQMNVMVQPLLLLYPNITTTYVPVFWVQEGGALNEDQASALHSSLLVPQKVTKQIAIWAPIAGIGMVALAVLVFLLVALLRSKRDPRVTKVPVEVFIADSINNNSAPMSEDDLLCRLRED
eukprot:TRINITY_DN6538_c0_g1_i1.p1 TRINITY_DN6538_c0_g1~~TRINITY_DN6538_c0_g1_i1.p1  ORF type:complete len:578 (+),score=110.87 TRINITY_DN6538_c0_g1_i1:159-1892(+)